jgi:anti-sigma B factor antagonist
VDCPEHLGVRREADGDRHTLSLTGDLDLLSAPALEAVVEGLCGDGAREVVLDLHDVDFVDSAGLRALIHVRRSCERHGCDFSLARIRPPAQRLFEVSGLLGRLSLRGRARSPHRPAPPADESRRATWGRRPDLDVPIELNRDAPRSARDYVRDLLRSHPSRELCEAAMILTSDLLTPIVARAPATFMQTGDLHVWVADAMVRVELLAPSVSLPRGEHEGLYDEGVFTALGAEVLVEPADEGTRACFTLHSQPGESEQRPSGSGGSAAQLA